MMNPTTGKMMINSAHTILAPVDAALPITLTIAQMSRASTIRPKMNSKRISSRSGAGASPACVGGGYLTNDR
jgi:hypothetical protein